MKWNWKWLPVQNGAISFFARQQKRGHLYVLWHSNSFFSCCYCPLRFRWTAFVLLSTSILKISPDNSWWIPVALSIDHVHLLAQTQSRRYFRWSTFFAYLLVVYLLLSSMSSFSRIRRPIFATIQGSIQIWISRSTGGIIKQVVGSLRSY